MNSPRPPALTHSLNQTADATLLPIARMNLQGGTFTLWPGGRGDQMPAFPCPNCLPGSWLREAFPEP